MKTVVIGAGAMGSLLGEEVWLDDIWKGNVNAMRSKGLTIEEKGKPLTVPVKAVTDITSIGKTDLVIYFMKTYQTERAVLDSLVLQKEDAISLTLQNGLSIFNRLNHEICVPPSFSPPIRYGFLLNSH